MEVLALVFLAIFCSLLVGQIKVVLTAVRHRTAGIGRFSYRLDEQPIGFWAMLVLETAALLFVALYLLGALGVVVP